MRLLDPWTAAALGLAAIAVVLVLHALRLRRGLQRISSTLLWSMTRRDLEGNVPWQRIRPSVLLFLRLLAVLLVALALARPVTGGIGGGRVLVLVDASASMSTLVAPGRTRLDEARAAAIAFVERTLRGAPGTEIAIGVLGARAELRTGFERTAAALVDAIAAIAPTDVADDLAAAVDLAAALRGAADEAGAAPRVVLFSDRAAVALPDGAPSPALVDVRPADVAAPNVGVVALGVRRDDDDPTRVVGLARLERTADGPPRVLAEAEIDGAIVLSRVAELEESARATEVRFEGRAPGEVLVRVRLQADDALAPDDEAALVLAPRRAPRVLLVAPEDGPDPWLTAVLVDAGVELDRTARADDAWDDAHDLVVFDRVAPDRWPAAPALVLGATAPGVRRDPADPGAARRIASWRRTDDVLRHAVLDGVAFDGAASFVEDASLEVLARDAADRPIVVALSERGLRHVIVGFAVARSNWPADLSFPIVLRNVIDAATAGRLGREAQAVRAGTPIDLVVGPEGRIRIDGPASRELRAEPGSRARVVLDRAGLHAVEGAVGVRRLAVAVVAAAETDPATAGGPAAATVRVAAASAPRPVEMPAHRLVLVAAFLVLLAEWLGHALASGR